MRASFRIVPLLTVTAVAFLALASKSTAVVFTFDDDPFLGSTALTTPGRQIVGGEQFITFDPATDSFVFDSPAFGVSSISFFNGPAASVPATGVNTIVLQTFDNDANPATPFGAGNAANLIAAQITVPTPGFFIYFNQGLDLARLVYSTDLNDNTSDLKILARMLNLSGAAGRDAFDSFTAANFSIPTPPVSSVPDAGGSLPTLLIAATALVGARRAMRRASAPNAVA